MSTAAPRPSAPRRFFAGVGLLGQGLRMWITNPRIMLTGAIPALVVALVYLAGFILLARNLDGMATALTPFATEWGESARSLARAVASLALIAAAVLLVVYTFAAITLTVGSPFYERISRRVEDRLGGAPQPVDVPLLTSLARGAGDGIRVLGTTVAVGLALFACGFIPVIGQTVVPVLGAVAGGWFLALELTGFAFEARGVTGTQKRRMLRADRATTLGFGVASYLLFLVPFAAVVVMPAAVAGGTMLARSAASGHAAVGLREGAPSVEG